MNDSPYIIVATTANFASVVVEKSKEVPVLADFWASWCAPCQMLMPVLTRLANEYQGKFILAKVNSDEQQKLAMQYGVRSIPTLKLFHKGAVAEDMVGAQPESAIRQMLERYIERPADKIRAEAMALHTVGQSAAAIEKLQAALAETPNDYRLHQDLAEMLMDVGQLAKAEELITRLPANVQADPEIIKLLAYLHFAKIVVQSPPLPDLESALTANPDDHFARYQLSAHKVVAQDYEQAMELLLELMRRNRSFQEGAARKGLLAIFTLLDNQGGLVNHYRSKMSLLLY